MKFVSEKIIDETVVALEKADNYEAEIKTLRKSQPVVLSYLMSENFEVLTTEEREYLLYLTLVIIKSARRVNPQLQAVEQEKLGAAEESNYTLLQSSKERRFRDKLTVFFEKYPQEDLLAFAEDALVIDDETTAEDSFQITKEGREPVFLALKSIIDALE